MFSLFQALGSWERKNGRAREKIREAPTKRAWNRLRYVPPQGCDVDIRGQIQVTAFLLLVLKLVMGMLGKSQKRIVSRE